MQRCQDHARNSPDAPENTPLPRDVPHPPRNHHILLAKDHVRDDVPPTLTPEHVPHNATQPQDDGQDQHASLYVQAAFPQHVHLHAPSHAPQKVPHPLEEPYHRQLETSAWPSARHCARCGTAQPMFVKSKLKSQEPKPPLKPAATSLSHECHIPIRKSTNDTSVSTRKFADKSKTWKCFTELTKPRHNLGRE